MTREQYGMLKEWIKRYADAKAFEVAHGSSYGRMGFAKDFEKELDKLMGFEK